LLDTTWKSYVRSFSRTESKKEKDEDLRKLEVGRPCSLYALAIARGKMAYLPPVFFSFSCGRLPSATGGFVYVYYIRNKCVIFLTHENYRVLFPDTKIFEYSYACRIDCSSVRDKKIINQEHNNNNFRLSTSVQVLSSKASRRVKFSLSLSLYTSLLTTVFLFI